MDRQMPAITISLYRAFRRGQKDQKHSNFCSRGKLSSNTYLGCSGGNPNIWRGFIHFRLFLGVITDFPGWGCSFDVSMFLRQEVYLYTNSFHFLCIYNIHNILQTCNLGFLKRMKLIELYLD